MFAGVKATPVSDLASVSSCEGAHLYLSSELNNSVLVVVDIEVLSSGSVRAIAHSCNTHDQGRRRGPLSPQAVAKVNLLVATLDAQSFVFDFIVQIIMDQVRHARPKLNLHETLKSLEQFKTAANVETLAELVRKEPTATRNWHCSIKVCRVPQQSSHDQRQILQWQLLQIFEFCPCLRGFTTLVALRPACRIALHMCLLPACLHNWCDV